MRAPARVPAPPARLCRGGAPLGHAWGAPRRRSPGNGPGPRPRRFALTSGSSAAPPLPGARFPRRAKGFLVLLICP